LEKKELERTIGVLKNQLATLQEEISKKDQLLISQSLSKSQDKSLNGAPGLAQQLEKLSQKTTALQSHNSFLFQEVPKQTKSLFYLKSLFSFFFFLLD
jgi:hypothetical protein